MAAIVSTKAFILQEAQARIPGPASTPLQCCQAKREKERKDSMWPVHHAVNDVPGFDIGLMAVRQSDNV